MSKRSIVYAALCTLPLLGCTMPLRPPADVMAQRCETEGGNRRCEVVITRDDSGNYACDLGRFRVTPDLLELQGGRPVNIQWSLRGGEFAFCERDGLQLKDGFESGRRDVLEHWGSSKEDASNAGFATVADCKPFRNWRWGNSGNSTYAYEIQFSSPSSGRRCKIDPFVKNG